MESKELAFKFACALIDIAKQNGLFERFDRDIEKLRQIFCSDQRLYKIFDSPGISSSQKEQLLKVITDENNIQAYLKDLLKLLLEKKRMHLIVQIALVFHDLSLYEKKILKADVLSAHGFSEEQRAALSIKLEKIFRHKIRLHIKPSRELLAGFIVRIGSHLFDYSLKTNLDVFKKSKVY